MSSSIDLRSKPLSGEPVRSEVKDSELARSEVKEVKDNELARSEVKDKKSARSEVKDNEWRKEVKDEKSAREVKSKKSIKEFKAKTSIKQEVRDFRNDIIKEELKIKQLIKSLNEAKGRGTSMISLIIPPGEALSITTNKLINERATAENIKSRVNRLSVQSAITSVIEKLKCYPRIPRNGLIVYSGLVESIDGKEKQIIVDFEPFKPINTKLYLCDKRFHTKPLEELFVPDNVYGFIIIDARSVLFGTLSGTVRTIVYKKSTVPRKHNARGGQSAARLERIRREKDDLWIKNAGEQARVAFIKANVPNVVGLIIAGMSNTKDKFMS